MPAYSVIEDRSSRVESADRSNEPSHVVRAEVDLRGRFVAAADWVLVTDGFANFKVKEVCRRAGLSTRCFYGVFANKDELLAAMLEKQFTGAAGHLRRTIDPELPPVQRVRAHIDAMLDFGFDRRFDMPLALFAMYWRALLPHFHELAERCVADFLASLVDAIAEGAADGALHSPDPWADAKAIFHLVVALLFDQPSSVDRRAEVEVTVRRLVGRALKAPALVSPQ
ncbi:TetR/AcrR family transcriptional regulator [Mycolicibacterium anyangense]|uniref:TetR/AcrR family transcriptional regulator n=1 Tax=Mycolicibacterium anyangense TaxID=1431246 RepID=UPI0013CF78D5|nr:TetR/AcrR family transcriptional regulator [Mycolicibacterium anyangense]